MDPKLYIIIDCIAGIRLNTNKTTELNNSHINMEVVYFPPYDEYA